LIALLGVLEFRSSNTTHRPVIEALAFVKRHAGRGGRFYPAGEDIPIKGVVREDWRELVLQTDSRGRERIVRGAYEIAVFEALRERLRCEEIWAQGADRWRNPDEDHPPTSRRGAPSTTPRSASRWLRRRSSTSSAARWKRPWRR
jgi:hypothetical protein